MSDMHAHAPCIVFDPRERWRGRPGFKIFFGTVGISANDPWRRPDMVGRFRLSDRLGSLVEICHGLLFFGHGVAYAAATNGPVTLTSGWLLAGGAAGPPAAAKRHRPVTT